MENNSDKIQVIIAAKQFFYRMGVKTILSVIGIESELFEVDTYDKIKSIAKNDSCSFIIISESMLPAPQYDYLDQLTALCLNCRIMIIKDELTEQGNTYPHFLLNTDNQKEILEKFQDFFFEPEIKNSESNKEKSLLSDREIEVLKTIALGYSNKEIADELFISTNTVITHRKNITDKLGIKTIAGLTVYAIINSLINPEEVRH